MVPKLIHYCWFGGNPKPEVIQRCIASWKAFCPDFEIIEWNESNYDVNAHPFTKAAYEAKKWAFISDVARLEILLNNGGIYLDTDVEILCERPFDAYLDYDNVVVFETERAISSGLFFVAEKGSKLCRALLEPYQGCVYSKETETINSVMNKPIFANMLPGLEWNGKQQVIHNSCVMGTAEYGRLMKHHGMRSWCDDLPSFKVSRDNKLKRVLRNPKIFTRMESSRFFRKLVPIYEFAVYDFLDLGPIYYVKRIWLKMKSKRRARRVK